MTIKSTRATTLTLLTTLAFSLHPLTASAVESPSITTSISLGPSWILLGEVGKLTKRGFSANLKNSIEWPYIGLILGITRSDYLTTQDAPPYNYVIGLYAFQVGITGHVEFWNFGIHLDPSYRRYGILSNSLIRYTGTDSGFNAVGADLSFSYTYGSFYTGLRSNIYYIFGINTIEVGAEAMFGVSFGN